MSIDFDKLGRSIRRSGLALFVVDIISSSERRENIEFSAPVDIRLILPLFKLSLLYEIPVDILLILDSGGNFLIGFFILKEVGETLRLGNDPSLIPLM